MDSLGRDIAGVCCSDVWSWFICHCGLCQETRTMIINQVEGGVWRGPAALVTATVGDRYVIHHSSDEVV